MYRRLRALIGGTCLLLAACGGAMDHSSHSGGSGPTADGHAHDHTQASTAAFGVAADPSKADTELEVVAKDSLVFVPDRYEVGFGETITFVVHNEGRLDHEFVLGDESYQESHSGEMGSMEHAEGNGVVLPPGETGEVTWTFTSAGEVLFACHVDDHYSAGMVGSISVK